MNVRFLTPGEIAGTKPLAAACFGTGDWLDEYYDRDAGENRVAVLEEDGAYCAMVQLRRYLAIWEDRTAPVWYLLYVCTAEEKRRRGYMDRVMGFVLDALRREGESFTFLIPVEEAVYTHLGFVHGWQCTAREQALLYADEGLTRCVGCMLDKSDFHPPREIRPAARTGELPFAPFDAAAGARYFDYFSIRPNTGCDSVALESVIYSQTMHIRVCEVDQRCLFMLEENDGVPASCIPFCREEELPGYFLLLERYFNNVLHQPLRIYGADPEGVACLRRAGLLDGYEVVENAEIYDYLYSGEELRTLAGKKFVKKRNRISKFCRDWEGRWEYRPLSGENRQEILSFLQDWDAHKTVESRPVDYVGTDLDTVQSLQIDVQGVKRILDEPALMEKVRSGGIYVDGALRAFSMGAWNPRENMAVIVVEKADPTLDGLYQLINREFLCHAFPEAELVNREDDVGLPGLRKSKLSYHPIRFVYRYFLRQITEPERT